MRKVTHYSDDVYPCCLLAERALSAAIGDRDIGDPDVSCALAGEVWRAPADAHAGMAVTSIPTIAVGRAVFRGTPPSPVLKAVIDRLDQDVDAASRPRRSIAGE